MKILYFIKRKGISNWEGFVFEDNNSLKHITNGIKIWKFKEERLRNMDIVNYNDVNCINIYARFNELTLDYKEIKNILKEYAIKQELKNNSICDNVICIDTTTFLNQKFSRVIYNIKDNEDTKDLTYKTRQHLFLLNSFIAELNGYNGSDEIDSVYIK